MGRMKELWERMNENQDTDIAEYEQCYYQEILKLIAEAEQLKFIISSQKEERPKDYSDQ